jgi:hypothetical protein
MQKLRWTECGWSRGVGFGLWNFQSGLMRWQRRRGTSRGVPTAPSSSFAAFAMAGAWAKAFVSRSQAGRLAATKQMCSWHARPMQGRPGACLGRSGSRVMVPEPASGRAGGQIGEGLCGSRDRPADCPTFADRRLPRSFGPVATWPEGRAEATGARGRRLCA